jgi:glucosamine kinase
MASRPIFSVGVDLGGSWIRVQSVDEQRKPLKSFRGPTPPREELFAFFKSLWKKWGVSRPPAYLTIASRGVWTLEDRQGLKRILDGLAEDICVLSDVEIAFESSLTPKGTLPHKTEGILILAGTGSIAFGRDPRGQVARAGGLGPSLGDEGSGFWIGKQYMRLVAATGTRRAWVQDLVRSPDSLYRIAALASTVVRSARKDKACANIVSMAQTHLATLVVEVVRKLQFNGRPVPISWAGGLFKDTGFRSSFLKTLSAMDRKIKFVPTPPRQEPVMAAALWGGQVQGLPPVFLTRK